jgi:lon-related putative ATP-dependent protease
MERSPEACQLYARLFATLTRNHQLRPLGREAVARLIEHAARLAGDAAKTTTHLRSLTDLLREADHWASTAERSTITREDIQQTIEQQTYRAERVRERVYENICRGTILIDTTGERIGQINGLSVLQLGQFTFGQPTRITATTRLGEGKVIDIERETELGGPIHSKGVLILSSFLAARYAAEQPLSLAASLVFEQSYGMVEGDSASLAELCALLSALAGLPLRQSLAVTGSVNQLGRVQPIGGVNEKVEGFFDVCEACGLTGEQGVIIPAANVKHLMLRHDVVAAAGNGQFRIWAVSDVDQAVELLTGTYAGEADSNGNFPPDSVNGRVAARLTALSELRRRFAGDGKKQDQQNA